MLKGQTRILFSPNYRQLAAMALFAIESGKLNWRHHGIGVLQAYLLEQDPSGSGDEHRIHIWHPSLEVPGMEYSGNIHDHRFDMTATVLFGDIDHDEYHLTPNPDGEWQAHTVVNARKAFGRIEAPKPDPQRYSATITPMRIGGGQTYMFPKRQFHRSGVKDYAVSVVMKTNQEKQPARILSKYGMETKHGFDETSRAPMNFSPIIDDVAYLLKTVASAVLVPRH